MLQFTKKMIAIYSAIIFFVGLDRFFKIFALVSQDRQFNLIGEILKFEFKVNYYIAFSLPLAGESLAAVIGLIIITLIFASICCLKRQQDDKVWALGLIILGASSNLFDRIKYGYVIDYLNLKYFTVFNLADVMIVAGVAWLVIVLYKKR